MMVRIMRSLEIFLVFSALSFTFCHGDDAPEQCGKVVPLKNADWSKLVGSWYHLMHIPGATSFLNCREMYISNVNDEEKAVDIDFNEISYSRSQKQIRKDLTYFRWYEEPGVIYTSTKTNNELENKKEYFNKKKSTLQHLSTESKGLCHTLISTDYISYIIMIQCNEEETPIVWISLKQLSVSDKVADEIRGRLTASGIDSDSMDFNIKTTCGER